MKVTSSFALSFTLAACASIHSVESTTDTGLAPLIRHQLEDSSVQYEVNSSTVNGYELSLVVEQSETCATVTTPRVHRRRYIERHADSRATRVTWGVALAGLGAGSYGYVNAESLAARSTDGKTPDEYRQCSAGMVAVGALAAVIGIIDAVRATDSDLDDGVIKRHPSREVFACRHQRTRNTNVTLTLANDHLVDARTDEDGVAKFTFLDVPEDGLPTDVTTVELVIDGRHVVVDGFDRRHRSLVREQLLADPRSRLAIQVLERRREACNRAVNAARAAIPADPADVTAAARTSWMAAKSTCTDLWTPQLDAELHEFEERIVNAECQRRLERAAAAFVDDSGTTVGEMGNELARLHEMCRSQESVGRLRNLDGKLAATLKRLEREAAAEARQEARERARAADAYRKQLERARTQRSIAPPEPSWPPDTGRSCCKVCTRGKACGNSCIAAWKTCHKGVGCACDG